MKHILVCKFNEEQHRICSALNHCEMDSRIIEIGDKLKQLRIEKGYNSYEVFAWDNEIPRIQYWRMEKGTNFTIQSLLRVLDAHNITLEDFFNSESESKK